jgi:D-alanine-D-alanine ligase
LAVLLGNEEKQMVTQTQEQVGKVDVVFPVLHGTFGEDGTMQGLLELLDVAYVGADVLGSAVGMDKDVMKRLLRDASIPIGKFIALKSGESLAFNEAKKRLGIPMFIKPANLGSSVGVSKVKNEADFTKAMKKAFLYDSKILIEEFIDGREVECSVLGNENPIASVPGEVIPHQEFYSYEAKYIDENGAGLEIPAKLSKTVIKKIQELAIKTFLTLCCTGMGRVDCFVTKENKVYVNEINTIPGFTKISMYPKLWEASGIAYPKLIDRLITLAIERHQKEKKIKNSL